MKSLSKKDKYLLIFIIALGIFYGYYALLLKPAITDIKSTKGKISEAKACIKEINTASVEKGKYKKQYTDLKNKYEEACKTLPQNERSPEIAVDIKALCDKNNIALTSLNFSKPVEVKNVAKIMSVPITMNSRGDYEKLVNFLNDLEQSKRMVSIDTVTFTSDEKTAESGASGGINMVLNASYYFIVDNVTKGTSNYDFNKGTYGKTDVFK